MAGPTREAVVPAAPLAEPAPGRGLRVDAVGLRRTVRRGVPVLQDVSLSVRPGEVVAIVGGSGAGKTTLLEVLAGVRAPDGGSVRYAGVDLHANLGPLRGLIGYVPQDDIIHTELPLARTLRYAAQLRLPATDAATVAGLVDDVLATLDLADRADVRVGALSGGQRKRASIAVELLTDPGVFFLDEPTSGLDPVSAAELLRTLRGLASAGTTVVFTTHAVGDLGAADRVAFLARGGVLAFVGTVPEALAHFGVDAVEEVYGRLAEPAPRGELPEDPRPAPGDRAPALAAVPGPGAVRQWSVLTRRTFETLARNRLTMAILLGSPVMIVAMFAVLFRPGAFDPAAPSPSAIVMIVFWVTFGAFFFGLTYGLLQICTERPILRREHLVGLRLGAYLVAKATVLLPFLVAVVVLMLAVLRALDRLPAAGLATYLSAGVTLVLVAAAGLTLGLLTSAAVGNPSQATLALPMLCFPAVLFSGAILPVHVMAGAGAAISTAVPVRWGFEGVGRALDVRTLLLDGGSPLGPPLVATYGDAGTAAPAVYWAILAGFTVACSVAAWLVLRRTCARATR
jgi:ABC-type multidrug transport system ATPase subunit/ABC-type transport system involved in multi-copper enzyme maturation permease subunit